MYRPGQRAWTKYYGPLPYYVSDELRRAGAIVKNRVLSFIPHTITDRELITGQNPFAADKLGKELTGMLKSYPGRQAIPASR